MAGLSSGRLFTLLIVSLITAEAYRFPKTPNANTVFEESDEMVRSSFEDFKRQKFIKVDNDVDDGFSSTLGERQSFGYRYASACWNATGESIYIWEGNDGCPTSLRFGASSQVAIGKYRNAVNESGYSRFFRTLSRNTFQNVL